MKNLLLYYRSHPDLDAFAQRLKTIDPLLITSDLSHLRETLAAFKADEPLRVLPLFFTPGISYQKAQALISDTMQKVVYQPVVLQLPHFAEVLVKAFDVQKEETIILCAHETKDLSLYEALATKLKAYCHEVRLVPISHHQPRGILWKKPASPLKIIPLLFTNGHHMQHDIYALIRDLDINDSCQDQLSGLCEKEEWISFYQQSIQSLSGD